MAESIICPACKQTFRVPRTALGAQIRCPNPACGHRVDVPAPKGRTGPGSETCPKPRPSRPALLDQMPASPVTSPAFIAIAVTGLFLYGIVLAGVLASRPKTPLPAPVYVAPNPHPLHPAPARPIEVATATSAAPSETAPPPKSEESTKPQPAAPKPSKPQPAALKPSEPAKAPPAPTPPPVRVAEATKPAVPAPPKPVRALEDLGAWIEPVGDCKIRPTDKGVSLSMPGKLHILSAGLDVKNGPRLLGKTEGDFVAQVLVSGEFRPGMYAVKDLPVAFQGAGLLVWKDQDNFLRLERAVLVTEGRLKNQVFLEATKDNELAGQRYVDVPAGPLYLRLERRGDLLRCSYSRDEKTWHEARSFKDLLPGPVGVGLSAGNTAKKPLQVEFEKFSLAAPPQ